MDLHQGKGTDDGLGFPVLTYADVVKQSFHQFAQQANNNGGSSIQVTDKFDTNLQDLNDDCLLEIFSLKFLDPMDLCSLAETCLRFKQITQRAFPNEFSEFLDDHDESYPYLELKGKGYNLRVMDSGQCKQRLFENFGSCLSAVSISYESVLILSLVPMYCGDNLKSLKIVDVYSDIPNELIVQLKPILKQLEILHIYRNIKCKVDDKNLFADCDSLIELSVCCSNLVLGNTYPKLERFTFYSGSSSSLLSFFSRHKSLKTVYIAGQNCFDAADGMDHIHILQTISRNCQELEELAIPVCDDWDLTDLQNLGQLKKLEILSNFRHDHIRIKWIHQLQSLKSLETLGLDVEVDDFFVLIPALAQLKKLRELHLYSYSGDPTFTKQFASLSQLKILRIYDFRGDIDVILHIISVAVNLEKLKLLKMKYKLTKKDFSKIVNLVKGRSKVLTLKCDIKFSYDSKNCDKNQKVKYLPLSE